MDYAQQGGSSSGQEGDASRVKRPRSTMACIRCRKKKVKCDFVQPTCGRCTVANLPCSYATPPRRVDGHAFDVLGNHVEELKERMQRMQSELQMMKSNLNPYATDGSGMDGPGGLLSGGGNNGGNGEPYDLTRAINPYADQQFSSSNFIGANANKVMQQLLHPTQQTTPVTWKLSLSPSGLRIDTNIASVADLYRILLNGISQLNINQDALSNTFSTDSLRESRAGRRRKNKALETANAMDVQQGRGSAGAAGPGGVNHDRLVEISEAQAEQIYREQTKKNEEEEDVPQESLNELMDTVYHKCFAAYCIVDRKAFMTQYYDQTNPHEQLLLNSVYAWMSKHGRIHHNANPGRDTNTIGESYFKKARQLLKKCFDVSSTTTIHALLNLYQYQLASERHSQAYLYIGLAIRMAQDLKLHKKDTTDLDPLTKEMNKRLWWSSYWLDLCAALETNRPTMVDDKDCDLEFPSKMDHEDEETGFRVEFCVHSIKLMKIRKDITKHLPSEQSGQSLLSAISKLENSLTVWNQELPQHLHYDGENGFARRHPGGLQSFRDDACLILNIAYQTTWIMLHKFFLPKVGQTPTPVALLSLNICTKSANTITKLLDTYSQQLDWCQFFYNLDGVLTSVLVHRENAKSPDVDVQNIARRNLLITAEVLKKSPLIYMDRVNDIIESIEEFRLEHNITGLDSLPVSKDGAPVLSTTLTFPPDTPMGPMGEMGSPSPGPGPQRSAPTLSPPQPQFVQSHPPSSQQRPKSNPPPRGQSPGQQSASRTQQPMRPPHTVNSQPPVIPTMRASPGVGVGSQRPNPMNISQQPQQQQQVDMDMSMYPTTTMDMLASWPSSGIADLLEDIPYPPEGFSTGVGVGSQADFNQGSINNFSSSGFSSATIGNGFMMPVVSSSSFTPGLTPNPYLYDDQRPGGSYYNALNPQTAPDDGQIFGSPLVFNQTVPGFQGQPGRPNSFDTSQSQQHGIQQRSGFPGQQSPLSDQANPTEYSNYYDNNFPEVAAAIMESGLNPSLAPDIVGQGMNVGYDFFQPMDATTGQGSYGFYPNAATQNPMSLSPQQQGDPNMQQQWNTTTSSGNKRKWDE